MAGLGETGWLSSFLPNRQNQRSTLLVFRGIIAEAHALTKPLAKPLITQATIEQELKL